MTKINHTYEQIASYLTGNMNEQETKQFELWLKSASPEELDLFEATKNLWKKTTPSAPAFAPDVDKALKQVEIKRQFRQESQTPSLWKYAAVIALLIAASITAWFLYTLQPSQITELAKNDIKKVDLPDGSMIWLSPGTTISYENNFLDNREIHLSGKAFFEVAKRNGQPFTVFSANTKTQVLGTSFNLETKADGQVAIQVTTGKVAFSEINMKQTVFLTPGKQAEYTPKRVQMITTSEVQNENYRSWQTHKLAFNNTPASSLFETLEEYYQTNIEVSNNLQNCRFTTSFDNQSLDEVLEILELTGNLKITQTNQGFQVSGSPCN